jgi:hypothetical protein
MTTQDQGPTPADRAAGIAAATDTAIAGTLRKLSQRVLSDIPHAEIGQREAHRVDVADLQEVVDWLQGWAIRIENGEPV